MSEAQDNLRVAFSVALDEALAAVVDGARDDLRRFARQIADDAAIVMAEPDVETRKQLQRELVNQVRAIGEVNRLRANEASWVFAGRVVDSLIDLAIAASFRLSDMSDGRV